MNAKIVLLGALALVAAPLAYAHDPAGTYKNYCEDFSEWLVHDYGPPASGNVISGYEDGNLQDCDGDFDPNDPFCVLEEVAREDLNGDGEVCELADFDGHAEYSRGGAWLLVNTGAGAPSADPSVGAGTLYCFGAEGHHANFVTVGVDDIVLRGGAEVAIAADTVDLTGTGEGCGDFQSDEVAEGTGTVTATFPPGLDGTYQVYVRGTQGHVFEGTGPDPALVGPTPGGPVFTSTFGAAPTVTVPPGWTCEEVIPWTGGVSGSGTIELLCTADNPSLRLCQLPVVSVYLYSGTGAITGSTGCLTLDASCTAMLPLSGNPTVASCADQSGEIFITGLRCRIDVAAGEPYFAWSANCSNDP